MSPELLAVLALCGATLCWLALAAPAAPNLNGWLRRLAAADEVELALHQAELHWVPVPFWIGCRLAGAVAAGLLAFLVFRIPVLGLLGAFAAYQLAGLLLEFRRRSVEAARQRALLDAIRFGSAVMARAGTASQMLESLAESGPFQARRLFAQVLAAQGKSSTQPLLEEGIERVRAQLADPLFDDLALALTLHWRRGGKLVPALEALVGDWEETLRLQREAKAMRAGVEASVLLLAILPFFFLFLLQLLAPALLAPLRTPAGEVLFALAVAWMVVGYRILQKIAEPPREERVLLQKVGE